MNSCGNRYHLLTTWPYEISRKEYNQSEVSMVTGKSKWLFTMASLMILVISCALPARVFARTSAQSAELNVLYIEYPPYYASTPDSDIEGIIVDIVRRVFERAGVSCTYTGLPSKRVISKMQQGEAVASLGWFKTAERETFAKFSLPIYLNQPIGILMLREEAHRFSRYDSIKKLVDSRHFMVGRIDGHSDGEYLDSILVDHGDRTVWVAADEVRLIKMLKSRRFDYILLPPEELGVLTRNAGYPVEDFVLKPMSDIPHGNVRYIMYAKSIDDDLIKRIDDAIVAEIGILTPSP